MFKVLDEVCEPKRGTKYSAYVDLFAGDDVVIGAGETKVVKLGVKLDLEKMFNHIHKDRKTITTLELENFMMSHYLEVALRSSLAVKGLIIANGIGIIDLDYPDEIGLIVHLPISSIKVPEGYSLKSFFSIQKGDKVAQCTLKEHKGYLMGYESDIIRDGGYGSTGK
jgi:dUTPase